MFRLTEMNNSVGQMLLLRARPDCFAFLLAAYNAKQIDFVHLGQLNG